MARQLQWFTISRWFLLGMFFWLAGCMPPAPQPPVAPPIPPRPSQADTERLTAEWAYKQGLQYLDQRNFPEATRYLQLALERDAMHLRAYLSLGDAYTMQNQYMLAESYYHKVLQYDPNSTSAYAALGNMQRAMGNYREALSFYHKVLELDPSNQSSQQQIESMTDEMFTNYYQHAQTAKEAGDFDAALIEYQKAYALASDNLELALEIGQLFLQQRDYPMADRFFQDILAQDANYLPAILGAGRVQLALNHYDQAKRYFQDGLAQQPGNQEAAELLGRTQREKVKTSLPAPYFQLANAPQVTRGDVAALLLVELMLEDKLPTTARVAIISDITTHWAKPYIIKAVQLNLMPLPPDRYFRPEELLTRGEFASILAAVCQKLALPLTASENVALTDVPSGNAWASAIQLMCANDLMQPVADGTFGIQQPLSGAEVMAILAKIKKMTD